jgi:hypothetical protein
MTYEEVEFVISAGLGRNEWVLLISFPDNIGGNPSSEFQRLTKRRPR